MTRIKICGLRHPRDADYVNEAGADYAGFVLWPGSRRCIDMDTALSLRGRLRPDIPAVGVFVDTDIFEIEIYLRIGAIDIVQLHGHESEADIRAVQRMATRIRTGSVPVWKAFQIRSGADIAEARESPADLILLDNGHGSGKSFDWSLLSRSIGRPWLLAGGLTAENVPEAIRRFSPFGVDISSGVETSGAKDREKVLAAVRAAHGKVCMAVQPSSAVPRGGDTLLTMKKKE